MKKSKLKRVINNHNSLESGFYRICGAFNSHLYKEVDSFVGWYCAECDKYDLYKIFYKHGEYTCVHHDHITYETKVYKVSKPLDEFIKTHKREELSLLDRIMGQIDLSLNMFGELPDYNKQKQQILLILECKDDDNFDAEFNKAWKAMKLDF